MISWRLQNMQTFDIAFLRDYWRSVRDTYPWLQLWGQMSDYGADCCDRDLSLHARYSASTPSLTEFLRTEVAGAGTHGGYHTAPYLERSSDPGDRTLPLDTTEGQNWMTSWLEKAR